MRTSEQLDKIAPALAAALPAVQNAVKDAKNPHFRSTYATLAAVIDTTKPVLAEHGITVLQSPGWHEGRATVTTRLLHASGQWIEGTAETPVAKQDPQGVGSAITYLRRYGLAALAGITQEDDDGNTASQRRDPNTGRPNVPADLDWTSLRMTLESKALEGLVTDEAAIARAQEVIRSRDAGRYANLKTWLESL